MLRKLGLIVGAVLALGTGIALAPAPAAAYMGTGINIANDGGGLTQVQSRYRYHGRPHYRPQIRRFHRPRYYAPPRRVCDRVVVRKRINGYWRRVVERRCYYRRY